MNSKANNFFVKILFVLVWFFFLYRLTFFINPNINLFEFPPKDLIVFLNNSFSIVILISLFIYLLIYFKYNFRISLITILIIYPMFGLIGYLINIDLHINNSLIWHQFITLTSLFLFLSIIDSNKIFDYEFTVILLKIILLFALIFFLLVTLPQLYSQLNLNQSIRNSDVVNISLFNKKIDFVQNMNGAARILFVLQLFFLLLFKKFIFDKKITAKFFFLISIFLITLIYLTQSRFNIIASFIFAFLIIISIKNLHLIKKTVYFLIIIYLPIYIFSLNADNIDRFTIINEEIKNYKNFNFFQNQTKLDAREYTTDKSYEYTTDKSYEGLIKFNNLSNILDKLLDASNIPDYIKDDARHLKNILPNFKKIFVDIKYSKNSYVDAVIFNSILKKILPYFDIEDRIRIKYIYYDNLLSLCSPTLNKLDTIFTGRVCGWEILLKNMQIRDLFFGKGYFADQLYLSIVEKTSSNTWLNILFNTGIFSFLICLTFIVISFFKFFNIRNIYNENVYLAYSSLLIFYFIARSMLEDTLAFVNLDLLIFSICLLILKKNKKNL